MARIKIVYCDNTDKIGHCVCDDILVDGVLGGIDGEVCYGK